MKLIGQSHEILDDLNGIDILRKLERCARVAYQSEPKDDDIERTKRFVASIIKRGHESVLEHGSMTVKFITDRGITHELVRHRIASFTQESTRYCNYSKGTYDNQILVIPPVLSTYEAFLDWSRSCETAEKLYMDLIKNGTSPQIARSVLPTCLKAEIIVTANWREWRHILKLRTAKDAHPQMRSLMIPLLDELKEKVPVLFDDIETIDI